MNKTLSPSGIAPVRILLVDDHPNMATMMARAMSNLGPGIEILTAESGEQALELVSDKAVDLLITDMVMPGINGLELIEKLQAHPGGRPAYTALVTAFDVPGLKESARRLRVNDVLNKPVRPERMSQIISKAIEELGRAPDTEVANARTQFKILVADDRSDNIALLSRYLENEGYLCITAIDGEQALGKIRAEMPDLVLLDVNMPVKDGFEALQEIRSDPAIAHIPVIILTAARLEPMDMQYALNIGADDYITKPFDRRELLARIRTRLRVKETEDTLRLRNRELSLLPEIGRELSARLDIDELTDLVLRRTVETLGALVGHFILLTPQGMSFKSYRFSEKPSPATPSQLPALTNLLAQVNETRKGIIINDAHKDQRWPVPADDPIHAVIIVPLYGRLGLLGLLILAHEQTSYFRLEHKLLLQAIAGHAAIALENAQLYSGMAQEQQRMRAVLQNAADAILMFDKDGRLSLLNPTGEKLFSDGNAKLGSPLQRGYGYEPFMDLLDKALASREAQSGEITWPDQRVFHAVLTPIEASGCVAILNDVSHFKKLERVKNEFIATATHGLKNTLTKITLMSQLIPKLGKLNEKQKEYLNNINETTSAMDRLVQNLLELAKIDAGGLEQKFESVKVDQLIDEVVQEFQVQAKDKRQILQTETTKGGLEIKADFSQLRVALRNLISNAIKYTPEKGTIVIAIQSTQDSVILQVKDNGYGIPKDDLPFIFERFYRVYNEKVKDIEGNGLGLAVAKSFVEQNRGKILVESEYGKGSCFTIALPLA